MQQVEHPDQERFIQAVLDAFPAHVAILDENGVIVAVNEAWKRFGGNNSYQDRTYGIGLNYLAICDAARGRDAEESHAVAAGIRDVISRRRAEFSLEYPCHSPRVKRWFLAQITRFIWNGQLRVVVAHHNVTELKKVQVELEESRQRIEAILNNVPGGIMSVNNGGRIEALNPAALKIFGYTAAEITGQDVMMLFSETGTTFRRMITGLQETNQREVVGKRRDGSTFPLHFAASEMYLGARRIYNCILEDLTERKRIEAELFEKERIALALDKERDLREFKGRFMSMMSHELRTPLASIQLSSDLLKRYAEQMPPDERESYLDNITTQIDHLSALIKDMSMMSKRTEISSQDFSPRKADFIPLVRKIVEEYQLAGTHDIEFFTTINRLNAMIDLKLMRQVLNNLLSNAVKYSPTGSKIQVEIWRESKRGVLSISDEGIGIPPEDLPTLFEPFHRAGNVGDTPGTGLGLAVVRQSLEMHGGSIEVESEAGKGTTFTVYLPYQE